MFHFGLPIGQRWVVRASRSWKQHSPSFLRPAALAAKLSEPWFTPRENGLLVPGWMGGLEREDTQWGGPECWPRRLAQAEDQDTAGRQTGGSPALLAEGGWTRAAGDHWLESVLASRPEQLWFRPVRSQAPWVSHPSKHGVHKGGA